MRGPAGTIWGDPIRPLNGIDGLRGIEISGDHNTVGLFIASLRQSGYRSAKIYLRQGAEARTGSTRPARYHADWLSLYGCPCRVARGRSNLLTKGLFLI